LNAERNEGLSATVSERALMSLSPILGSFDQEGIRPHRRRTSSRLSSVAGTSATGAWELCCSDHLSAGFFQPYFSLSFLSETIRANRPHIMHLPSAFSLDRRRIHRHLGRTDLMAARASRRWKAPNDSGCSASTERHDSASDRAGSVGPDVGVADVLAAGAFGSEPAESTPSRRTFSPVPDMKRMRRIEIANLAWCPPGIHHGVSDFCRFLVEVSGVFNPVAPLLAEAFQETGARQVLDLGSGAAGPWPGLPQRLRKLGIDVPVCLSDCHPDLEAFERSSRVLPLLEGAAATDTGTGNH
jgi:hypothetical protein